MEIRVKYAYDNVYSIAGTSIGGGTQELTPVGFGQEKKENEEKNMELIDIFNMEDKLELIISLDTYINEKCEYGEKMCALSEAEKVFLLCQDLEREVNNGGFHQYFFNSSGDNSSEIVAALKEIGADATAEIAEQALSFFPNAVAPSNRDERQELLESIDTELFSTLDDKFYAYPDDLAALNYHYVSEHRVASHLK